MSTTHPTIPPETARQVLGFYGHLGGAANGPFTRELIASIDTADIETVGRLANAHPSLVAAVIAAKLDPDGVAALQRIAGGIRCMRCGDTDGPFKGTPADVLCEGCINAGGAW